MSMMRKIVAWLCIYSTFLFGCSSSTMIVTSGKDKEQIHSGCIQYIITKDNKRYAFDGTPDIVNDSVVGRADGKRISIPLSDVAVVSVKEIDWLSTTLVILTLGIITCVILYYVEREKGFRDALN